MDTRFRPLRAVVFVILCLGLLGFTYFLVYRVDFGGSTKVTARFASVGTIQSGSPVRQSGVKVGSVSKVALAPDDRRFVDVELSLYQGMVVRSDDRVSIVTGGLLGDQFIDILPGRAEAPLVSPDDRIKGESGLDLKELVSGGGDLVRDLGTSGKILAQFLTTHEASLDRILADAERGTKSAADAAERADRLLAKAEDQWDPASGDLRATLKTLRETSVSLRTLVDSLGSPGTVAGLLASPATAKSTAETLSNLQAASASLKTVTSALENALK